MANFFQNHPQFTIDDTHPIQLPGTTHGPCADVQCIHIRCKGKRVIVYSMCQDCNDIIGWVTPFKLLRTGEFAHKACVKAFTGGNHHQLPNGHRHGSVTVLDATPKRIGQPARPSLPPPRRRG
jgi:hypothetical protein